MHHIEERLTLKLISGFCLLYILIFVAWRHLQPEGILFYQGVLLALLLAGAQWACARRLGGPYRPVASKDALITFLLLYSAVFTVPTTVDRAYSVRMILQIEKDSQGLTREQIQGWFSRDFAAQGGVDKRLQEQLATGSIVEQDGHYKLTPLGRLLAHAFRVIQYAFATKAF